VVCTRTHGDRLSGVWAQNTARAESATTGSVGPWCQFRRLSEAPGPTGSPRNRQDSPFPSRSPRSAAAGVAVEHRTAAE
jgi:hypothetical protein